MTLHVHGSAAQEVVFDLPQGARIKLKPSVIQVGRVTATFDGGGELAVAGHGNNVVAAVGDLIFNYNRAKDAARKEVQRPVGHDAPPDRPTE